MGWLSSRLAGFKMPDVSAQATHLAIDLTPVMQRLILERFVIRESRLVGCFGYRFLGRMGIGPGGCRGERDR